MADIKQNSDVTIANAISVNSPLERYLQNISYERIWDFPESMEQEVSVACVWPFLVSPGRVAPPSSHAP